MLSFGATYYGNLSTLGIGLMFDPFAGYYFKGCFVWEVGWEDAQPIKLNFYFV